MNKEKMTLNASRIVKAISKIGYKPSAALMDILDNSVMAKAKNITIEFDIEDGCQINRKNNVIKYRIIDDGVGMSLNGLKNALTPGSDDNYSNNSLSKYGMGLKSAGFSLGEKICVLTKQDGDDDSIFAFVDEKLLEHDDGYYVYLPEDFSLLFNEDYLKEKSSGTIVELQDVRTPHEAALTTINLLREKLGVTYYGFLTDENNPLHITIKYLDNTIKVGPHDILFKNEAKSKYEVDKYDYESPYLTHKDFKIEVEDAPNAEPININVSMFPAAKMSSYGDFSKGQKDKVASYKVNSKNKGFFVYRNGRLIRWGDSMPDGKGGTLIGRDEFNLRVSLEFETQHDEALEVDVSKQRFTLPEQVSDSLKEILIFPKAQTKEIRELCTTILDKYKAPVEGGSFNENNSGLVEEDSEEAFTPVDKNKEKEKRKRFAEETANLKEQIDDIDSHVQEHPDTEEIVPQKIRYSDKVPSNNLWEVGIDAETGVFVILNKNHPYYLTVFKNLNESSSERQSLEALFWSIAAAESIVRTKLVNIDDDLIEKVMKRFKNEVGYNINHWVSKNSKLFS